ncbi:MAG: hypothetical protein L0227_10400 [Chloroflexi bacterium]|nr:hypothetical protein [Chloroflexota bacterium]
MATDPDQTAPASESGDPEPAAEAAEAAADEASPAQAAEAVAGEPAPGTEPPGLREQIGAAIAAARRLVTAHVELAKSELGAIMGEVGRVAALGGLAVAMAFLVALLIPIGMALFLGDLIFGSIGWGVLLGSLLLIDIAVLAGLLAVGLSANRLGLAFLIALAVGLAIAVDLGFHVTNRIWTAVGDNLPGVDASFRPLAVAVLSLAVIGGLIGLIGGLRSPGGSAGGGLVLGAFGGIVLGVVTALTVGLRVGAALGALTTLIAWPALMGLDVARTGVDGDALKARFYPGTTIETTKETIEWVRHRTPLGRKS